MERGWALASLQSMSSSDLEGSPDQIKIREKSWENPRFKMADKFRGNKYGDPRPTEYRTKLNFILIVCLNKIGIAELIAQRFLINLKVTVESSDLPAAACVLSTVVHRSFKVVLTAEWGSWVGSQFSAPSVKSRDSLRFSFAEF